MFQRFLWKLLPKEQRRFLLGRLSVVDRQVVNKAMSGTVQWPPAFAERNCLFIHVPKCAGSSLCAALFNGQAAGHIPLHWYEQQFPAQYAGAFKFTFVRDPLERAYSAYTFLRGNQLNPRDQAAQERLRQYRDFDDFVARWLHIDTARRQIHFAPQTDFLLDSLGHLGLDFIGRQEHLNADFQRLCERLGMQTHLPHLNGTRERQFAPVHDLCSVRTRRLVRRVYQRDYEMLGYE